MKVNCLANPKYSPRKTTGHNFNMLNMAFKQRLSYGKRCKKFTGKELDAETGLYYYGARYLDPKTSRWLSGDPALGEYFPSAPVNDEAKKRNGNLPGMGGVFNYVNLHAYHYAGNNPVKYVDPDGRSPEDVLVGLCNKMNSFVISYDVPEEINYDNGRNSFSYKVSTGNISEEGIKFLKQLSNDNACSYGATQFRNEWKSNRIAPVVLASTLRNSNLISYYRDDGGKIINDPSILASKVKIGDILVYTPDREVLKRRYGQSGADNPGFTGHIATIIGIDDEFITTLEFHMKGEDPTIQKISKDHLMNFDDCKLYGAAKWND